ncbi:MalY/PatB family protein [Metabacillus herbersteinensis]|uniref:cysteine-S-conjugate beta-lyase n=1 Tax=Metabacillus herbersteinensis TaxID=283816 RepID=A0ABV6GBH1_9BACI
MNRFDALVERKMTNSVKWDLTKEIFGYDELLPMWVADMDFPSPDEVLKALHERVNHGVFGYTIPSESTGRAIQQWVNQRHNWKTDPKSYVYSSGVVAALSTSVLAYTEPGDQVVVQPPVYYPFFDTVEKNNRVVLGNELLLENGRYEIDFDDLGKKLAEKKTKLFFLCNPQNPSGRVWRREELERIAELCIKHDVLIISDEIHSDLLLFGNKHIPIAYLSEELAQRSITCISPSKTFNIAGLQAAAIIIPNDSLRRKYNEIQSSQGFFTLNTLGIVAMEAAYSYGEGWLNELLSYLEENVTFLTAYLQEKLPAVKVMVPESTYLVWLDASGLNLEDNELKRLLLQKGKLALEQGSKYGKNGAGFLRMNIACPRSTLEEGLKRFVVAFS